MKSPLFSIIIPTFNSEATIATALESIAMQSFWDYEVLIFDNGSKDKTLDIIKKHGNTDLRLQWWSERDNGIYDAMNKGIGKAIGQWLFFLGSDDSFYSPLVLAQIKEAIENNKTRMVYGNVQLNKSIGFNHDSLIFAGEFHASRLLHANICHQSVFYHESLFKEFGLFNTKYKLLADWDFNLRCFSHAEPFYVDMIVANFFAGASSSSGVDEVFKTDLVKNMVFSYPYSYRHHFFKKTKRALAILFYKELKGLHLMRALKVSRVLLYQLRSSQ